MTRRASLLLLFVLAACPSRSITEHKLGELGLEVTLPPDWRGGKNSGAGAVFVAGPGDATLSFIDAVHGLPLSEAGAHDFLEQRVGAKVDSTGKLAVGKTTGFVALGTSGPGAREYVGCFAGPRGPVWVQLTTRRRPAADADALWKSIIESLR